MPLKSKPNLSINTYRQDPMFPRIERVVLLLLARGNVVAPVDVLVGMGILRPADLLDWREGRVPFLERVIQGSLSRLTRLLRILRMYAHDLNLKPSITVYVRHRKRPRMPLRFTKTGDTNVEEAYSRHFIWPGKLPFHLPATRAPTESVKVCSEAHLCH